MIFSLPYTTIRVNFPKELNNEHALLLIQIKFKLMSLEQTSVIIRRAKTLQTYFFPSVFLNYDRFDQNETKNKIQATEHKSIVVSACITLTLTYVKH